jgi:hypothetical protein
VSAEEESVRGRGDESSKAGRGGEEEGEVALGGKRKVNLQNEENHSYSGIIH